MKAKELKVTDLMVGDLVLHDGKVIRVDAVHKRKIGYHKTKDKLTWLFSGQFEPILLTPEILEKNGFETEKIMPFEQEFEHRVGLDGRVILDNRTRWIHSSNTWSMYIRGDLGFTLYAELTFVHELQQFLRLCKIDKEIVV